MARNGVGVKGSNQRRIQQRVADSDESDEEYKVTDDEDFDESDECYSLDGDESEEISADFGKSRRVSSSRNTRRKFSGKKVNEIVMPRKRRRTYYKEDDDDNDDDDNDEDVADEDDAEFMSFGREANQVNKSMEKKRISYTEVDDDDDDDDDDDYTEFVSSGRNRNQRKKPREKKRVVYTDEDEDEFMSLGREVNQIKKPTEKKRVSYMKVDDGDDDGDEDDYAEIVSLGRKRNRRRKPQEKKRVVYTEEDDDDDEFMYSGRKVNQKKNLREKRKVSYTEDDDDDEDDDDSGFIMTTSRKRNQINEPREKRTVSYKEDNEEDEDENDAEFKLSDSDFLDDEDETPKIKKNEKVSRSLRQKKIVRGGRKKSKKSKVKKPTRPRVMQVTNKNHVKKRSNNISEKRKQSSMAESDSDFVNSASSDHEYTISEEEREQMREARIYCANLRAKLRSSSFINQEKQPTQEQRKYPIRKGKEKIEDVKDELGKQVCGICLSEEGKRTVRGVLNCCQHYFCFSCIMEWSKVESRCPLCKQRFSTIRKASKSDTGFDLRTVVIPVPECDQVYEPSEEELRGYLDPYESVICTECQNGGDDALMLLCDICDSSAHTFCVGLGREVPEGNWYCEGCKPTVFGTLNSQNSDRRLSNNASDLLSSPVAGGFDLNELYVPETPLTQQTRVLPETIAASTGTVATTLRDRRRIHRQIHHRFLNNNRMSDLSSRSSGISASSSGIRLFGSQLDQARVSLPQNDHVFPSMHDTNNFYPRSDQFSVEVQNSNLVSADVSLQDEHGGSGMGMGMGFDSRMGYSQIHPCTNRSSIGTDACQSPYACREVIGPSRTSQGGFHTPY